MNTAGAAILGACIIAAALIIALVPPLSGEAGRYQVGGAGENCIVLDTKTGQVWRRFFGGNSGPGAWTEDRDTPWNGAADAPRR